MKRLVALFAAALAISLAGSLGAMTLEPQAALSQSQPVILGEVAEVGNHSVTVTAPGQEQMTFEFDSRTVMPAGLENGERVKVEYRILDSGLHLAQRVTPLTVGSRDWTTLDHEMSMVPPEDQGGSGMLVASTATERGEQPERHEQMSTMASNEENNETPSQEQAEEQSENQQNGATNNNMTDQNQQNQQQQRSMPRTASQLPWLLVGSGALMFLVGGLWLVRRGRTV